MSEDRREDRVLEEFLQRRSRVSKAYRDASGEQPPPAVDQAILAASRRAAGSGPRRLGWTARWAAPLAAAAVLVLGVAVVLRYQDEPQIAHLKEAEIGTAARPEPSVGASEEQARPLSGAKREAKVRPRPQVAAPPVPQAGTPAEPAAKAMADRAPAPAGHLDEAQSSQALRAAPVQPAQEQVAAPAAGVGATADSATPGARDAQRAKELEDRRAMRKQSAAQPETLLERIEADYAQGRTEEGDRALRQFCRDFPGHALPEELGQRAVRLRPECAPPE